MKTLAKTFYLVAILLACAITPLLAQSETTNEANPNNKSDNGTTSLAPQAEPKPQIAPVPQPPAEVGQAISNVLESTAIIVAIVTPFACIVAVAGLIFKARRRRFELLHETLRAMIEKGVPIPPELLAPPKSQFTPPQSPFDAVFPRGKKSDLRSGLIMLALGLGLLIFFSSIGMKIWPVGFIFMLLGCALLLVHKFEKKNAGKSEVAPR